MCQAIANYSVYIVSALCFLFLFIDFYIKHFKASKLVIKDDLIERYVALERLKRNSQNEK